MNKSAIKSAFKALRKQGFTMSEAITQLMLKYELWQVLEAIKSLHNK